MICPRGLVALGATAAKALLGSSFRLTQHRGELLESELAPVVAATIHPSAIVRDRDAESRVRAARARERPAHRRGGRMTDRAHETDGEQARRTRDRQVMEVLQELRVAITGGQILFGSCSRSRSPSAGRTRTTSSERCS